VKMRGSAKCCPYKGVVSWSLVHDNAWFRMCRAKALYDGPDVIAESADAMRSFIAVSRSHYRSLSTFLGSIESSRPHGWFGGFR